jgi:hypothetical protein
VVGTSLKIIKLSHTVRKCFVAKMNYTQIYIRSIHARHSRLTFNLTILLHNFVFRNIVLLCGGYKKRDLEIKKCGSKIKRIENKSLILRLISIK